MATNESKKQNTKMSPRRRKEIRSDSKSSMSEAIRKMRLWTFILMMVEFLGLGALIAFYFLDLFKTKEWLAPEFWIYIAAGLVVANLLLLWFGELKLSHIRQKNDLDASRIIGSDVQEAYNFGELGLAVADERDCVVWVSPLIRERRMEILDVNILAWHPELKALHEAKISDDTTVDIKENDKVYQVKYLSSARLYIFRDVTEHRQLSVDYHDQMMVLGVVIIDNYEDITGKTESENSDLVYKVRAEILKYFTERDSYLRRFRNDSYYLITTTKKLRAMEEDRFSILDNVHNIKEDDIYIRPTISIGIAYNANSVVRLNQMASNALDIAMSRGGDQVVVSKYGDDLTFYGGKTAQIESSGRVQFRSLGDSLKAIIDSSDDVLVSGHSDADMDAIGACFGIKALCNHLGKKCRIIFDADRTERKTREAVFGSFSKEELQEILITSKEASNKITPTTLFILVDVTASDRAMGKDALEKANKIIVIDHHRVAANTDYTPVLSIVETTASSSCELITELINYMTINPKVEIPESYATMMLGGIFLDTLNFESKSTGSRTFEAAQILMGYGARNDKIYDFFRDDFEEVRLVASITSKLRVYRPGILYALADDSDIVDEATISKVANQLIHISDVKACFVVGRIGSNTIKVSGRSDGVSVNVQIICENIAGKNRGGGHFHMAAASFPGSNVSAGETLLIEALKNHLDEAMISPSPRN